MSPHQGSTEVSRIADQLRRFYKGPSWLGPSLKTIISKLGETAARQRLHPDAHTIWELVLHITAWLRIARERLTAIDNRDAAPEEDWPSAEGSWEDSLAALESEVWALEAAILAFGDERLQQRAPAREEQTYYQLLHGVVQHSAYHAGQIALLTKLV